MRHLLNPFPDHRDLYLLVAGAVLGILLSPLVLGRVAPGWYDAAFRGGGEAGAIVDQADAEIEAELERLKATGVSEVALAEHRARRMEATLPQRLEAMEARWRRERTVLGWMTGLIVAAVLVMAIEALVAPAPPAEPTQRPGSQAVVLRPAQGRLKTVRYALLATWLALAIAQPTLLKQMPLTFTLLVIVVGLAAGLAPLGPRRESQA